VLANCARGDLGRGSRAAAQHQVVQHHAQTEQRRGLRRHLLLQPGRHGLESFVERSQRRARVRVRGNRLRARLPERLDLPQRQRQHQIEQRTIRLRRHAGHRLLQAREHRAQGCGKRNVETGAHVVSFELLGAETRERHLRADGGEFRGARRIAARRRRAQCRGVGLRHRIVRIGQARQQFRKVQVTRTVIGVTARAVNVRQAVGRAVFRFAQPEQSLQQRGVGIGGRKRGDRLVAFHRQQRLQLVVSVTVHPVLLAIQCGCGEWMTDALFNPGDECSKCLRVRKFEAQHRCEADAVQRKAPLR
jgi:hypothetical protein